MYKGKTEVKRQPNILIGLSNSNLYFLSTSCQRLSLSARNYLFVLLQPIWTLHLVCI